MNLEGEKYYPYPYPIPNRIISIPFLVPIKQNIVVKMFMHIKQLYENLKFPQYSRIGYNNNVS